MSSVLDRVFWFGTPLVVTLFLHSLIIAALLVRWYGSVIVEAQVPKVVAIKATLVSAASLKPKPSPKLKQKPKSKPESVSKSKLKPKTIAKPEQQSKLQDKPEFRPDQTKFEPRLNQNTTEKQLVIQTLKDIETALASEQVAEEGGVEGSLTDTIAAIIRQSVIGRWTRPPSARNGMIVVLQISLAPMGDLIGVSVLKSSGNIAFDRSAINAVEKAARFSEVRRLERADFERNFRRFQLIFRPEDLRY